MGRGGRGDDWPGLPIVGESDLLVFAWLSKDPARAPGGGLMGLTSAPRISRILSAVFRPCATSTMGRETCGGGRVCSLGSARLVGGCPTFWPLVVTGFGPGFPGPGSVVAIAGDLFLDAVCSSMGLDKGRLFAGLDRFGTGLAPLARGGSVGLPIGFGECVSTRNVLDPSILLMAVFLTAGPPAGCVVVAGAVDPERLSEADAIRSLRSSSALFCAVVALASC